EGVADRDGIEIPKDEIPQGLKEATAELARFMVDVDRTSPQKRDGLERMKVDVIEIEFDKNYRLPTIPLIIADLISD
ncbi:DnaT-like ssDNA-binding protein, partial [Helicobacter pylori]|uniref:DnaT-like ssDNA-binding protein n=1 Tax=Helicobacter pylori TaxID=210 RepID=UPI002928BD6D